MRIISFSNASAQLFLAVPVQALTPWMTHLKNSLRGTPIFSTTQRAVAMVQQSVATGTTTACGHSVFASAPEKLLLPCKPASKALPSSSLRIVREFDSAISPDCAGRMVISGRMADVCAELDRMAVRATATQ